MPSQFLGKGIYEPSFASRITRIPTRSIKRCLLGYKEYSPVIRGEYGLVDGKPFLSFLDLIEVRFLYAFKELGVSWTTIREAAEKARDLLETSHPFSTKRFSTDGKNILVTISKTLDNDKKLMDITTSQLEIPDIVEPILRGFIEFKDYDSACCWRPMGRTSSVMLDPKISFGRPVVGDEHIHVPTDVIKDTFNTTGSTSKVSSWYGISEGMVREAIEYEKSIAAL